MSQTMSIIDFPWLNSTMHVSLSGEKCGLWIAEFKRETRRRRGIRFDIN